MEYFDLVSVYTRIVKWNTVKKSGIFRQFYANKVSFFVKRKEDKECQ